MLNKDVRGVQVRHDARQARVQAYDELLRRDIAAKTQNKGEFVPGM